MLIGLVFTSQWCPKINTRHVVLVYIVKSMIAVEMWLIRLTSTTYLHSHRLGDLIQNYSKYIQKICECCQSPYATLGKGHGKYCHRPVCSNCKLLIYVVDRTVSQTLAASHQHLQRFEWKGKHSIHLSHLSPQLVELRVVCPSGSWQLRTNPIIGFINVLASND